MCPTILLVITVTNHCGYILLGHLIHMALLILALFSSKSSVSSFFHLTQHTMTMTITLPLSMRISMALDLMPILHLLGVNDGLFHALYFLLQMLYPGFILPNITTNDNYIATVNEDINDLGFDSNTAHIAPSSFHDTLMNYMQCPPSAFNIYIVLVWFDHCDFLLLTMTIPLQSVFYMTLIPPLMPLKRMLPPLFYISIQQG